MQLLARLLKSGPTPLRGVQKVLDQAQRNEARVSLYLGDPPEPEPIAEARIHEAQGPTLTLRLTKGDAAPSWHGAFANCALLLTETPGLSPRLVHFRAKIINSEESGRIVLTRPEVLNAIEQRSMQRIALPDPLMPLLKAWPLNGASTQRIFPPEDNEPLIAFSAHQDRQVKLRDISAGGLRLSVHESLLQGEEASLRPDSLLLLWMALPEPMWDTPMEYCLLSRITRNRGISMGWRDLGLQFQLLHGEVKHPGGTSWHPLADEDIPSLANWVNRRMDELRHSPNDTPAQ